MITLAFFLAIGLPEVVLLLLLPLAVWRVFVRPFPWLAAVPVRERVAWVCFLVTLPIACAGWVRTPAPPPAKIITREVPALVKTEGLPADAALRGIPPFRVVVEAPKLDVTRHYEAITLRLRTLGLPVDATGHQPGIHDSELRLEVFSEGCMGKFRTTVERNAPGEKDKRFLQDGVIWQEFRRTPDECLTAFANAYLAANPKK
jgi:hypothetical protein